MEKKDMSERDIITKYIIPVLKNNGWDVLKDLAEENYYYFTDGRIYVDGKKVRRGKKNFVDLFLKYKEIPLALIEAKDNNHSLWDGMEQATTYSEQLDVPFCYSTNGDAFIEHDNFTGKEREIPLDEFPSPEDLWQRYKECKGIIENEEEIILQDYFTGIGIKEPRYYQRIAINRTIEEVAKDRKRILLVMATGTGKTFTSFQIIWRLWKSKKKKKILFLVDRDTLVNQAMTDEFKHFGESMHRIENRTVDTAYEIYLALYQAITGEDDENSDYQKNIYKNFGKDFFDLIVIDECHRGSAKKDSRWREVLDYFGSATQIGLTATPKETNKVSNIDYFGEPIYTYSLKQGIDDGFLAPYKVIRIRTDKDDEVRFPSGTLDKYGNEVKDRIYNIKDRNKEIVYEKYDKLVAQKITQYLKATDRFSKTIIFCEDIEHAGRIRSAIANENSDLVKKNRNYVVRITAAEKEEGKNMLEDFRNKNSNYPVIVTTSKLLSTGVNVKTCKLIVLDKTIEDIGEFKQIIGRGTRIEEEKDKMYFAIMDFVGATKHFADEEFDGKPIQDESYDIHDVIKPKPIRVSDNESEYGISFSNKKTKRKKYYLPNLDVTIINEKIQYIDGDGKLITEDFIDYTRNNLRKEYLSLNDFLSKWNNEFKKSKIIEELRLQGIPIEALKDEIGKDYDVFDLICHIAFDTSLRTRKQRADNVKKKDYLQKYGKDAQKVIDELLKKYGQSGFETLENIEVLKVKPFNKYGTPYEIVNLFGGKENFLEALTELQKEIYNN